MKVLCALPDPGPSSRFFSTSDVDWRWRHLLERLVAGLEEDLARAGGELFLMVGGTARDLEEHLARHAFDGLITALPLEENDEAHLASLYARLPVVGTLGGWMPVGAPSVGLDDGRAVARLVDHLAAEEFASPAFFTRSWHRTPAYLRRLEAFRSALPEASRDAVLRDGCLLPEDEELRRIQEERGLPSALDAWWKRVDGRVDSLLCFSDGMAGAVLDWARERKLRVPEDLGVVGIDGAYLDSGKYADLTTVKMDFHGLGRTCLQTLLEMRNPSSRGLSRVRRIPGDLVVRRSSLRKSLRLRDGESLFLEGARAYAGDHFPDEDPTGDAAERAGLSRTHFRRKFGALAGEPFAAFVARLRLEAAASRLRTSGGSVTEIATEVGFHNLGNFNRLFKDRYGMSPREFRGGSRRLPSEPREEAL